jgi:hypothetical protein
VACNFQTGNNKIKLPAEYESVTQNAVLAALLSSLMSFRAAILKSVVGAREGGCHLNGT